MTRNYAVDVARLFRFLNDTQSEEVKKLGIQKSEQKKRQFLNRLNIELAKRDIIDVRKIHYFHSDVVWYILPQMI